MDMDNDKQIIKSPNYSTEEIIKHSAVLQRGLKELGLSADTFGSGVTRLLAAIAGTSYRCGQKFVDAIGGKFGKDSNDAQTSWVQVQYEFLFFFTHLAMRSALAQLGDQKRIKLQNLLGPSLADITTEAWFGHWPEKFKEGIKNDFYTNINRAELDYSECKGGLLVKDRPFSNDGLFSRLARNISRLSGWGSNPEVIMQCIEISYPQFSSMRLDDLIKSAGEEL